MSKPTMFVGSSSEGLAIAQAIADGLGNDALVTMWNENVFELNGGYLEALLASLDKFDFAVLVLTLDDLTESRGEARQAPRDNVLFECGLFMGRLGRDRTFVVSDSRRELKLPTDFAGLTLATYDLGRVPENPKAAVREACSKIRAALERVEYRQLVGSWRSRYISPYDLEDPLLEEDVEIKLERGGICIVSTKEANAREYYKAYGKLVRGKFVVGEWISSRPAATAGGAFLMTIHPQGNLMYGYYIGPNDDDKLRYAPWILARKEEDESDTQRDLDSGERMLGFASGAEMKTRNRS